MRHPELVYASDVQIVAEPGGLQLTFTRPRTSADVAGQRSRRNGATAEIIARVVLPPLAAQRLLRLLPKRLDQQQALAEEYTIETEAELARDPLLEAIAAAEYDDEPYTDEERETVRAAREEFARGEYATWEEVRRELLELNAEPDASRTATS